jgi:hypothetical protein
MEANAIRESSAARIHVVTAKTRRPQRTHEETILMVFFAMVFALIASLR